MKIITLLLLSFASSITYANGDSTAGEANSAICAACHGAEGMSSIPGYPNLAGQDYSYLVAQLKAFKSGERQGASSALMAPMTASLSEQDMKDLAAFYNQMGK